MKTFQKIKALCKPKGLRQLENIFTTDRKKSCLKQQIIFHLKTTPLVRSVFHPVCHLPSGETPLFHLALGARPKMQREDCKSEKIITVTWSKLNSSVCCITEPDVHLNLIKSLEKSHDV